MRRARRKYRFNRYMRRKWYLRVMGMMMVILLAVSCATTTPVITVPERPVLEYVDVEIPLAVQRNLLAVITYAQRLEIIVKQYELMVE